MPRRQILLGLIVILNANQAPAANLVDVGDAMRPKRPNVDASESQSCLPPRVGVNR